MALFIPLIIVLALAWTAVGVLLARWLKQAGHNRPFRGRDWQARDLYGGGVGHGKSVFGGGREGGVRVLGSGGQGRVKGI